MICLWIRFLSAPCSSIIHDLLVNTFSFSTMQFLLFSTCPHPLLTEGDRALCSVVVCFCCCFLFFSLSVMLVCLM
jgi:hypothetical protein